MDETDKIAIKDLVVRSKAGIDLWGKKSQLQPITINIILYSQPSDEPRPIEYEAFCNYITAFAEKYYKSIEILAEELAEACLNEENTQIPQIPRVHQVWVRVEKPRALLHAASVGVEIAKAINGFKVTRNDVVFVKDLRVNTILGITPWEREQKQPILLNLTVYFGNEEKPPLIRSIVRIISKHVDGCNYQTMESLAASIARTAFAECELNKITVSLEKTSILTFASSAGVEITRVKDASIIGPRRTQKTYRPRTKLVALKITRDILIPKGFDHITFITTRSDNIDIIYKSLESLGGGARDCAVLDTSFLYQSDENFLHIACKVATSLDLEALQEKLKVVDAEMEVIFYDDDKIPELESEFALKPLCDVASEYDDPEVFSVCDPLLTQLLETAAYVPRASKVIPIGKTKWCWKEKTFMMGILDVNNGVDRAVAHAKELVEDHVNIIDIGGKWDISEEEELGRLIPIIRAIRANGLDDIPISINTHRATTASKAIAAGADIINDYSGGTLDDNMYSFMAEKNVPVFLQHWRRQVSIRYEDNDVVSGVCTELNESINNAVQAGVRTWNIIINPGLGCSKDASQDHQILKQLPDIVGDNSPFEGFPCAIGVEDPAVCIAAIAGGADILRVSDVKRILDPIKVADDIYKVPSKKAIFD